MNNKLSMILSIITLISITGCDQQEKIINTRVEQSKVLQDSVFHFAEACNGKLSMTIELTGTIDNPMVTKLSCDDMDKTNDFFSPLSEKDVTKITDNLKRINNMK